MIRLELIFLSTSVTSVGVCVGANTYWSYLCLKARTKPFSSPHASQFVRPTLWNFEVWIWNGLWTQPSQHAVAVRRSIGVKPAVWYREEGILTVGLKKVWVIQIRYTTRKEKEKMSLWRCSALRASLDICLRVLWLRDSHVPQYMAFPWVEKIKACGCISISIAWVRW